MSADLLDTVHVTKLNVYTFGNIDFSSTSVAENYFNMFTFNDFLEVNRDQCVGYWKSSRNTEMIDFVANIK